MMISPEVYYEEYLKGKDPAQLRTAIRSLKQKIGRLKNTLEDPEYKNQIHTCPDACTQLECSRLYLERAKQALEDLGEKYQPSGAECKAAEVDASIPYVGRLEFSIGGFFDGHETRTAVLDGDKFHLEGDRIPMPRSGSRLDFWADREEFLGILGSLHLGEWRPYYDPLRYGWVVMDGIQWELAVYFTNGHKPLQFSGSNAYPYNFARLKELLILEDEEE